MRSRRYRSGTKRNKRQNHRPLNWYLTHYGMSGKSMYERKG